MNDYERRVTELMDEIRQTIATRLTSTLPSTYPLIKELAADFQKYKQTTKRDWVAQKNEVAGLLGNIVTKLRTYNLRTYVPPDGLKLTVSDADSGCRLLSSCLDKYFLLDCRISRHSGKNYLSPKPNGQDPSTRAFKSLLIFFSHQMFFEIWSLKRISSFEQNQGRFASPICRFGQCFWASASSVRFGISSANRSTRCECYFRLL
jgi:hypothetical protein